MKSFFHGWNAVSDIDRGEGTHIPVEIGLMLVVTAETQELAPKVAKVFNPLLLHHPVNQNEQLPSFAFPFSPAKLEQGPFWVTINIFCNDAEDFQLFVNARIICQGVIF